MIGAQYYEPIYLGIIIFSTLAFLNKKDVSTDKTFCLILTFFFILFIGYRPVSLKYFVDMYGTALQFEYWAQPSLHFSFDYENLLYDNLRSAFATIGFSYRPFFLLIASIYFLGFYWICTQLFSEKSALALLVCLGAFSTFSFATNGIKAGAASAIFLMSIVCYHKNNIIGTFLLLLMSIGFHHSMILPVAAFFVCYFYKKQGVFFAIWVCSFFVALFHIMYFQTLFAGFSKDSGDTKGAEYLTGVGQATKGFRLDFILYSIVPIIIGFIAYIKNLTVSNSYKFLINLYTLINAIWMLCMYAEFTNRIAYLSWFLYPIVLIYPFIKERIFGEDGQLFKTVVICHLGFTLFMSIIYYQ